MRYDPERRAAIMAWLVRQGVEITNIPHLAKHSPTPQASEGGASSCPFLYLNQVLQSAHLCSV